ncbi:transcription factor with AP2 domain-containing protein [Babesia ovata]|uniref:Transcription factor with AP2 domain-containing protein n=1 Tax=Babesia ovata TaxID=189622 RepID=A0A2H6KCW5_9APIC|nr:transcription factor with AP2 domain-containing protein [Babesia ovata]GBE60827.1 transcription factor with AP2 domain-containing protein [Babesia ovata]
MEDLHVEAACDISRPLDDTLLAIPALHGGDLVDEKTLHISDIKGGECIDGNTVPFKPTETELMSLASIETQPPPIYNPFGSIYANADFSYDPDKQFSGLGSFYNGCYGMDVSWPSNVNQSLDGMESLQTQVSLDSQSSVYSAPGGVTTKLEPEALPIGSTFTEMGNQDAFQQQPPSVTPVLPAKVVAENPIILVDKVERSLIVQWYENGVKREQRISYKKYGNAKAQQRAENLITKLLSGSTFEQLYPEKGPPVLTIFENVGRFNVTLTRDRSVREWRVEWTNNTGASMRARWSCKKVGNEEAKRRAETFANSLIQGTFNPRLLHKATGTRVSRNDMKFSAVVNEPGYDPNNLPFAVDYMEKLNRKDPAPRKKRVVTNPAAGRKRATGTTTRRRKADAEINPPTDPAAIHHANMPLNVSLPGLYPVSQHAPENDSARNHSYDGMNATGEALAAQNWLTWSTAAQKHSFSSTSEWDLRELQNDLNSYGKPYDYSQPNSLGYGDWMSSSMTKYGSPSIDAPMSMCELADDAPTDSQNANGPFVACYPYFPATQSICYSDPMSSQDQLGVSGSFFDTDFLSESQRTNPMMMSYNSIQWMDPDLPNTDIGSAQLMTSTNSISDGSIPIMSAPEKPKRGRKKKKSPDSDIAPTYGSGADVSRMGMATAWQAFNGFPMTTLAMSGSGSPSDFTASEMFGSDGGCIRIGMGNSTNKDNDSSNHGKDAAGVQEMPGFYAVPSMGSNGGMQSSHGMGSMGNLYY